MKIVLKKLTLRNFRGVRDFTLEADSPEVFVYGANRSGKSTLLAAFMWLLFGKDEFDRADYEIKTTTKDGSVIHRLEHEVSATIECDGREVELQRTYKEKWVKKRGSAEAAFDGHTTEFHYNGVNISATEYAAKINNLIDGSIFKLITNPLYFNSLDWRERRNILIDMAGVTDADVFDANPAFEELRALLSRDISIADLKSQIREKKKKIKSELDIIPARLDEIDRSMPEVKDWSLIENKLLINKGTLSDIDKQLQDKSKALKEAQDRRMKIQGDIYTLKAEGERIKADTRRQIEALEDKGKDELRRETDRRRSLEMDKQDHIGKIESLKARIDDYQKERDTFRDQWNKINDSDIVFDEHDFSCPTCKRAYDVSDIEAKKKELTTNFRADKAKALQRIHTAGMTAKKSQEDAEAQLREIQSELTVIAEGIDTCTEKISLLKANQQTPRPTVDSTLEVTLATDIRYQKLMSRIAELEKSIAKPIEAEDTTAILERKKAVQADIEALTSELADKIQIERMEKRRDELQAREKELSQALADQEAIEFNIEEFTKAKIDTVESRINSQFKMAKFKMFHEQINEGLKETCETTYDGVLWGTLNNAGRTQVGLDIIATLSEHYGVWAPIFLDNREGVSEIPDIDTQIINLVVDASAKKLTVKKEQEAVTA